MKIVWRLTKVDCINIQSLRKEDIVMENKKEVFEEPMTEVIEFDKVDVLTLRGGSIEND